MEVVLGDLPIIDWEAAVKLAGNKQTIAEELLTLFLKTLPQDFKEIQALYGQAQYTLLKQRVHKLHGAFCYCGLPRLKKNYYDA